MLRAEQADWFWKQGGSVGMFVTQVGRKQLQEMGPRHSGYQDQGKGSTPGQGGCKSGCSGWVGEEKNIQTGYQVC